MLLDGLLTAEVLTANPAPVSLTKGALNHVLRGSFPRRLLLTFGTTSVYIHAQGAIFRYIDSHFGTVVVVFGAR